MNPIPSFGASYAEARRKFLTAAAGRNLEVESKVHPTARGAQDEPLAIDVAVLGKRDAAATLLLTSGTHGVEGFCGSGCQVALLEDDDFVAAVGASGVSVVLLHALNPYGFSHLRRTNEDNVDLNRNFRDFTLPIVPNAAYAEVHDFILPPTWPPPVENEARIGAYLARHGQKALQAAITGGQCEFADGLCYGGIAPAWSNGVLRDVLRRCGGAARLGWIDFHTGLGPWGHGEKIFSGPPDAAMIARARAFWGADVTSFYDGSSTSAMLTGVTYQAVLDECPNIEYTGVALEYGVVPIGATLLALRAEQWLENHRDAPDAQRVAIKRMMRDAFYGDADDWKAMVYGQARTACVQALRALSAASAPPASPP